MALKRLFMVAHCSLIYRFALFRPFRVFALLACASHASRLSFLRGFSLPGIRRCEGVSYVSSYKQLLQSEVFLSPLIHPTGKKARCHRVLCFMLLP